MSANSKRRKDQAREAAIVAAIPCPACGARPAEPCREGTRPHDSQRGAVDRRPELAIVHRERRAAWVIGRHTRPPEQR